DAILLDIWMPGDDGIMVLEKIKKLDPELGVIMMSGHGSVETAVKAIKLGAFDFLEKPIDFDKTLLLLKHLFDVQALKSENKILSNEKKEEKNLIGATRETKGLKRLF